MPSTVYERRPTWEIVDLFPEQGNWSVQEYLALETAKQVEFTHGFLEFLPMPDELHFEVQNFIFAAVQAFLAARGRGVARYAPFRVRVSETSFREPDVCVLLDENDPRRGRQYWAGADFVVEVVSPDNPERDYWKKRHDYAAAKIPEYWIVDPQARRFTLLRLSGGEYVAHAVLAPGQVAASVTFDGLTVDVAACFTAGDRAAPNAEPRAST